MKPHKGLEYRADIDGLRAVAVLAVVIYHAFPKWMSGGYVGVDIFFVISGYLITSILIKDFQGHRFSFLDFYVRRIKRIFPALTLCMSVSLTAGWFLLSPNAYAQLGKHVWSGAVFISNFSLWFESGYFDPGVDKKILLHLWSLGIEEQFYIIWPPLLYVFLVKFGGIKKAIVAVIAISFILNIYYVAKYPSMVFYWPFSRFWELAWGGFLATLVQEGSRLRPISRSSFIVRHVASFVGGVLIFAGIFLFKDGDLFPGWRALVPIGGSLLIIWAGKDAWINRKILSGSWVVYIGLISYPLYLWHWVFLSFLKNAQTDPSMAMVFVAVFLSVVCAVLTYRFVELPLRQIKNQVMVVKALLGGMTVLLLGGIMVQYFQGFPARIPEAMRKISALKREDFQWEKYVRSGDCHVYDPLLVSNGDHCIEKKRPLVALWGDSYAGALYPGLFFLQQQRKDFGIAQLTSAACPPILDFKYLGHRNNCDVINSRLLPRLAQARPEIILLHTTWNPVDYRTEAPVFFSQLKNTIVKVKAMAPQAILYIVGPVPRWNKPLQECATDYYEKFGTELPERMKFCLEKDLEKTEMNIQEFAQKNDVKYLSLLRPLCNPQGCLTRVGPDLLDLESIDGGHISKATSEFLSATLAKALDDLGNKK